MQIGGIIAIIVAAAVSAAAVVSLGLGLGLGLGLRKPCAVATTQSRVAPAVDYICFDDKFSSQVPLQLSGKGFMKIGKITPTVSVFTDASASTYYPKTSLDTQCPYEGDCVVTATLSKDLLQGSTMTNFTAFVDNPDPCYTVQDAQLTSFKAKMSGHQLAAVYLSVKHLGPNYPLPISTIFTTGFGNTVTISGSGFIATKNADDTWNYPIITLTAISTNEQITVPAYGIADCTLISSNQVYSCNTLTIRFYGNSMASKGDLNSFTLGENWFYKDLSLSVTNTAISQSSNCSSSSADYSHVDNSKRIFVFEAPEITSATPNSLCALNDTTITVRGATFIKRQNSDYTWALPTVTVGDKPMTVTKESFADCHNMIANSADSKMYPADATIQQCHEVTFTIPANTFTTSVSMDLPIMINNPAPFPAPVTSKNLLAISPTYCPIPPTPTPAPNVTCPLISSFEVIEAESHLSFCASPLKSARQSITLNGVNFHPTTKVQLIYVAPLANASYDNGVNGTNVIVEAETVTFNSPRQIVASFHRDIPHGMYIVNVTNVDDEKCNSTTAGSPIPIYPIRYYTFANPSFVNNLVDKDVEVTTFGFKQSEYMLALLMPDYGDEKFGNAIQVPFRIVSDTKVVITVPSSVTNGSYQVIMVAHDGCGTQPAGPNLIISNSTSEEPTTGTPVPTTKEPHTTSEPVSSPVPTTGTPVPTTEQPVEATCEPCPCGSVVAKRRNGCPVCLECTTSAPTTSEPTTEETTTLAPATAEPTTSAPTTSAPTTSAPATEEPTTTLPLV